MEIGIISTLFQDKSYGKITTSSGNEAHFHKECLWDVDFNELVEGQQVEFEIQSTYKGYLAFHIRPSQKHLLNS